MREGTIKRLREMNQADIPGRLKVLGWVFPPEPGVEPEPRVKPKPEVGPVHEVEPEALDVGPEPEGAWAQFCQDVGIVNFDESEPDLLMLEPNEQSLISGVAEGLQLIGADLTMPQSLTPHQNVVVKFLAEQLTLRGLGDSQEALELAGDAMHILAGITHSHLPELFKPIVAFLEAQNPEPRLEDLPEPTEEGPKATEEVPAADHQPYRDWNRFYRENNMAHPAKLKPNPLDQQEKEFLEALTEGLGLMGQTFHIPSVSVPYHRLTVKFIVRQLIKRKFRYWDNVWGVAENVMDILRAEIPRDDVTVPFRHILAFLDVQTSMAAGQTTHAPGDASVAPEPQDVHATPAPQHHLTGNDLLFYFRIRNGWKTMKVEYDELIVHTNEENAAIMKILKRLRAETEPGDPDSDVALAQYANKILEEMPANSLPPFFRDIRQWSIDQIKALYQPAQKTTSSATPKKDEPEPDFTAPSPEEPKSESGAAEPEESFTAEESSKIAKIMEGMRLMEIPVDKFKFEGGRATTEEVKLLQEILEDLQYQGFTRLLSTPPAQLKRYTLTMLAEKALEYLRDQDEAKLPKFCKFIVDCAAEPDPTATTTEEQDAEGEGDVDVDSEEELTLEDQDMYDKINIGWERMGCPHHGADLDADADTSVAKTLCMELTAKGFEDWEACDAGDLADEAFVILRTMDFRTLPEFFRKVLAWKYSYKPDK
ncbi:hypothetical protein GE09DRAFT_1084490 [Coniochaeta sp. 2T2.1]|nr:hypothetical protein GE09DRAFT_1084490 [Coniochaeta sp. 2T2.1]